MNSDTTSNGDTKIDERFYTPRAQASTARSTGSYGTPRSYRSSVASSSSDGELFATPRNYDGFQSSISSLNTNIPRHQSFTTSQIPRSERRNLIPPYKNYTSHHDRKPIEANYFRFNHEEEGDEESRGENSHSSQRIRGYPSSHLSGAPTRELSKQDIESIFSFCRHGRIQAVANLLQSGVDPDVRDENHGNSILSIACQNGNKRLVKLALRNGANINQTNFRGNTPLHFCYKYGHLELGEYLIAKGADKELLNNDGQTCEDLANFN